LQEAEKRINHLIGLDASALYVSIRISRILDYRNATRPS
jgi:hypothetical protein